MSKFVKKTAKDVFINTTYLEEKTIRVQLKTFDILNYINKLKQQKKVR